MLVFNGAAQAVPNKGLNGLIACGGTLPTGTPGVSDFEIYVMHPDGSNRTNITDENPITDYNPLWTADGTKISTRPRASARRSTTPSSCGP